MKRLLLFLAFVASLTALAVSSTAQQPDKGDPFAGDEIKGAEQSFTSRFVKVRNASDEKLTVSIQYRTLNEANEWVWLPGEPGTAESISVDIDPGQEALMADASGKPITASRVRLWAVGQTLQFSANRDADLVTVPEMDGQDNGYKALEMDTFTQVFSPPGPVGPELIDNGTPVPPPGDVVAPQPNVLVESPIPMPIAPGLTPAPLITIVEPAPIVVIPLPPFIPLPVPPVPFPLDADLVASAFTIDANGVFTGNIINAGPAAFPGGRKWFVLKSIAGPAKFGSVVAQGDINALAPGGTQGIAGTIGPVTIASRYILALSPGDSKRLNDFSGVIFLQSVTAKSDLAAKVQLQGKKLVGTITNNGPELFKGDGKRTFQLGDTSGLVAPLLDKVPPLAVGASSTVSLDVSAAINAKTKFFLALNPGDDFKINDVATLPHNAKGKATIVPDLEAKALVIKGKKLVGTIVNNGPGEYLGGRNFFLGNNAVHKSSSIGALKVGGTHLVELDLSDLVLATNQTFKLHISGDDAKPANDTHSVKHTVKVPDLAAALTITGHKVKGTITNLGAGAYESGRTFTLSAPALGKTYQMGPIGKLKEKETFLVDFTLPKDAPAQAVVLSLNNGDAKPVNDIATQPFAPDAHDLKVSISVKGSNAKITITNVGATAYPATGKRTITLDRPGLKAITAAVPGPISKGGSKVENFSLVGATPGAKVTVKLSPGDPNPANDTASDTFVAFDLAIGAVTIKGLNFSIPVTNKGPAYSGADSYTITGPGKFKETGKIPNLPKDGAGTITHTSKVKLEPGTFTITLNVADANPANNKKDVIHKAAIFDLAIASVVIKGSTFAIQVTNKGPEYSAGDTYTITGPGKFKETGKIPKLPKDGAGAINHTTKAKLGNGDFTVTLNVKDDDLKNNTKTVNHKELHATLAIASLTRDGKNVTATIKNEGSANFVSGGGVSVHFQIEHHLPKGVVKTLPASNVPNIAAGATTTITVPDPGAGEIVGSLTGTASVISTDPNKHKKTVK
ncbi:MAG TPA: hypothetical protein VE988_28745 [Gemmataceae bacterium]|nr:hypothetical protein [Gemmataceae bacterium]